MSSYLLAFFLMLAAFLLITAAAAARALWRRVSPMDTSPVAFERPPLKSNASDLLLLLGVAMAWYNVSSGWIAQLTIYPLYADMSVYGPQAFHGFGRGYLSRLPIINLARWRDVLGVGAPSVVSVPQCAEAYRVDHRGLLRCLCGGHAHSGKCPTSDVGRRLLECSAGAPSLVER
jgi:hypothetical protein